jgi:hypothetical protein
MRQLLCTEDRAESQTTETALPGHQASEPASIVSLTGDMPHAERNPANAGIEIECREGCPLT